MERQAWGRKEEPVHQNGAAAVGEEGVEGVEPVHENVVVGVGEEGGAGEAKQAEPHRRRLARHDGGVEIACGFRV